MPRYAIGDTHGCLKSLDALLDTLQISPSDELYLLGDYVDRGPDSKGVIDRILTMQADGYRVQCLKGNHDWAMLKSYEGDRELYWNWLDGWGGKKTLRSYGIDKIGHLPEAHVQFLRNLPTSIELPDYLLVHAGLNRKAKNPLQEHHSLMFIRDWYSPDQPGHYNGKITLHGHTPTSKAGIQKDLAILDTLGALDLDAGCVYAHKTGLGNLCAFNLDTRELRFQTCLDI